MSTGDGLTVELKEGVGILTLDRPDRFNILNAEAIRRLADSLADIGKDRHVRALIITGEKHFCAGADIRAMQDMTPKNAGSFAVQGHSLCNMIEEMEKPVLAAIQGYALGAGCEIALACDIRIAASSAKLGQPEVNLGLVPGFGGTQRLARLVGIGMAKEMILTGRIIGAPEAERAGLVNRVVEDSQLIERAREIAVGLAEKSPDAIVAAKRLINQNHDIGKALEEEIAAFAACFASPDHSEGIAAFIEKRKPKFEGR
jgi:enoyl-CoA hydratase